MELKLAGKVAIVTGASKGIGAGIAKALAAEGAQVVVNYANSKTDADKVVTAITSNGGKAIAVKGNVSIAADVKQLFAAAKEVFGAVDIVVNNAGVYNFEPVDTITEENFHYHYNTNVLGPILTTQQALQYFPATGGNIINISSRASTSPKPGSALYASTKGALDTLSRVLARELAPRGVRVNTVAPGATATEGSAKLGVLGAELEQQFIKETPLGRMGQPEDIAAVVVFLASDAAGWLTGELITASGGL